MRFVDRRSRPLQHRNFNPVLTHHDCIYQGCDKIYDEKNVSTYFLFFLEYNIPNILVQPPNQPTKMSVHIYIEKTLIYLFLCAKYYGS